MTDVHDKKTRSYNMSQIKATNTKPEMVVRKFLHVNGFRYTLYGLIPNPSSRSGEGGKKRLPGKPDIVLPKYKTIIFIHGCFWHGNANCKYFVVSKTRTNWWTNKINSNKAYDEKAARALKKEGWKVITVWECALKHVKQEKTRNRILEKLCY